MQFDVYAAGAPWPASQTMALYLGARCASSSISVPFCFTLLSIQVHGTFSGNFKSLFWSRLYFFFYRAPIAKILYCSSS